MYRAKVYVDFDTSDILSELTAAAGRAFDAFAEVVRDDEYITFTIDAEEYLERFYDQFEASPQVTEVRRIEGTKLLVTKEANGASPIIRANHGKLSGIDRVHGTKRVFDILVFRREDLKAILEELKGLGRARLEKLTPIGERPAMLTDRQLEVVTTAYEAGYYESPRRVSASDLGERLGISHTTVLEHLRKAERTLLGVALENELGQSTPADRRFLQADH